MAFADRIGSRITSIFFVLPAGVLIGFAFALLLGGFLLLGRHPASRLFRFVGPPLTARMRSIVWRGDGTIWVTERDSVDLVHDAGSYEFPKDRCFIICVGVPDSRLSVVPLPDALPRTLVLSPVAGKRARNASRSLAIISQHSRHIFSLSGAIAGKPEDLYRL